VGIYLLRKIRDMMITLLILVIIVFLMFYVIPGNPARIMLGMNAPADKVARLEEELGINEPLPARFATYLGKLLSGDPGHSVRFDRPVIDLIKERLPMTLTLALFAFLLVLLLAIPLGLLAARRPGGFLDSAIHVITEAHLAIPAFFMAILLRLCAAAVSPTLNNLQYTEPEQSVGLFLLVLALPAAAIALPRVALVVQFLRDAVVEQTSMDYVRTARSKGATRKRIIFCHVLRNSMVPVVTTLGLVLGDVIGGSVIIEQVFMLPGIGRLLITAVEARDFPLTQGIILFIAFAVILVSFLVDLLNQFIDPRLRERPAKRARRGKVSGAC
jgi:peptide/nickel transport system permease protein